jgi:hypothetical protein
MKTPFPYAVLKNSRAVSLVICFLVYPLNTNKNEADTPSESEKYSLRFGRLSSEFYVFN